METIKKAGAFLLATIILATFSFFPKEAKAQVGISVSFQQFYDQLSPYGQWIDDPNYGYIWVPNVEADFQPYATNGRWVMTDYGNTWVSNYDWGWAPFHYGRWHYSNHFGWAWVPGYEWAPAWVSWRSGGGYYGWAPLGPGMGIQVNINLPVNYWTFVPQRYLLSNSIHRYYAPHRSVVNVYQRTTIINNTYVYNNRTFYSGPARREIQGVTRQQVTVHRIADAHRPGRGSVNSRTVSMYRPSIDRNNTSARPARIANRENISSNRSQNTAANENRGNTRTDRTVSQRQSSRNATQVNNSRANVRTSQQAASTAKGSSSTRNTVSRSTGDTNTSSKESNSRRTNLQSRNSTTSGGQTVGRANNDRARSVAPVRTATATNRQSTNATDNNSKRAERVQSRPSAERTSSKSASVKRETEKRGQQQANGTTRQRGSRSDARI